MRLKELEAYKDLAGKIGTLHVVMSEQALGKLELNTYTHGKDGAT